MDEIREQITHVARDLYFKDGGKEGHELDYWLAAESLVLSWYEPALEREKHVGESETPQETHVIPATHSQTEG